MTGPMPAQVISRRSPPSEAFVTRTGSLLQSNARLFGGNVVLGAGLITGTAQLALTSDPGAVGRYGQLLALVAGLSTFASMRLDVLIPIRRSDPDVARSALTLAFAVPVTLAFLGVLAAVLSDIAVRHVAIVGMLIATTLVLVLGQLGTALSSARQQYGRIAVSRAVQGVCWPAALALTERIGEGPIGSAELFSADAAARFAALVPFLPAILGVRPAGLTSTRATLVRWSNDLRNSACAAMLSTLSLYLPLLMLPVVASETQAGLFALAFRLISFPVALIGGSLMSSVPRHCQDASAVDCGRWVRLAFWFVALGTPIAMVGAITGGLAMDTRFGDGLWSGLPDVVVAASPWAMCWVGSQLLAAVHLGLSQHQALVKLSFADLTIRGVAVVVAALADSAVLAMVAISLGSSAVFFFSQHRFVASTRPVAQ